MKELPVDFRLLSKVGLHRLLERPGGPETWRRLGDAADAGEGGQQVSPLALLLVRVYLPLLAWVSTERGGCGVSSHS